MLILFLVNFIIFALICYYASELLTESPNESTVKAIIKLSILSIVFIFLFGAMVERVGYDGFLSSVLGIYP